MTREDLSARLLAYHDAHGCWGPLRPAFDDGDLHNTGLVLCRSNARARGDGEAHALLDALFAMQEVRRRILRREVMEALFAKAEGQVEFRTRRNGRVFVSVHPAKLDAAE